MTWSRIVSWTLIGISASSDCQRKTFYRMAPARLARSLIERPGESLFLDGAGQAGNVVLDEERIEHGDRQRPEQRTRHQRAPVVDVALDELGDHADRHGLHFRRR